MGTFLFYVRVMIMNYDIKLMQSENIDEVSLIEQEAFGPHHWSKSSFYDELQNNLASYYCLFKDGEIIGYTGFWNIIDEAHITTFAIKKEYRRQNFGEIMLRYIIEECYKKEIKYITLEVRVSNEPAIKLYEKYGFKSLGTRKNYYQDNNEDALIMWTENIFWDKFKANYEKCLRVKHEQN